MRAWRRTTIALAAVSVLVTGCGREPWWVDSDVTWIETHGGRRSDVGSDILLGRDGSAIIVGYTMQPVASGRGADVFVIRRDARGALDWTRTFGGEGDQRAAGAVLNDDGTLVIAGTTSSHGEGGVDALLVCLDRDGRELWSKTYGGPLDEWIAVVRRAPDGGFFLAGNVVDRNDSVANSGLAGYAGFDGRSSLFVIKTDRTGREIWSRAYDTRDNVISWSGLATSNGGYLALATVTRFPDGDDDLLLVAVDGSGNQLWSRTWRGGRSSGYEIIRTSDGNYLITGSHWPDEEADRARQDYLFIKADGAGNELWSRTFGDPDMCDYGAVVTEAADGGFVAAGTWSRDLTSRSEDISLIKIDKNGAVVWQRVLETFSHNMFGGIVARPDGEYVIAGSTIVREQFDVFVIQADSAGNVAR